MKKGKDGIYCRCVKPVIDFSAALILSVPSAVIVAVCSAAICAESKGPAFFRQERPGRNGKVFNIYKLRTMITDTEKGGAALSDMERMTRTGRIIRNCSLDELPQLLNILKGEMSFIGPRPLLKEYLPLYSVQQQRRHDVKPGISGWAQVNGRNELSWEQKFERDIWYTENVSFGLDLKILFMTVKNVLTGSGINAGEGETMKPFTGSTLESRA